MEAILQLSTCVMGPSRLRPLESVPRSLVKLCVARDKIARGRPLLNLLTGSSFCLASSCASTCSSCPLKTAGDSKKQDDVCAPRLMTPELSLAVQSHLTLIVCSQQRSQGQSLARTPFCTHFEARTFHPAAACPRWLIATLPPPLCHCPTGAAGGQDAHSLAPLLTANI